MGLEGRGGNFGPCFRTKRRVAGVGVVMRFRTAGFSLGSLERSKRKKEQAIRKTESRGGADQDKLEIRAVRPARGYPTNKRTKNEIVPFYWSKCS